MGWNTGTKSFTASGAVGTSDISGVARPIVVWDVTMVGGSTGTSITLHDGVSATATDPVLRASVASDGSTLNGDALYSTNGIYCPKGCYLAFKEAATATTATVSFHEEF